MVIRRYHLDKDSIDGSYHVKDATIPYTKLQGNTIYVRVLACQIEAKSGLAADSTGVKTTSPRFKFSSKHVKQLILRSSITSIPSDATVSCLLYTSPSPRD